MKNWLLFILILVNSPIFGCLFSPVGEDTRFHLFDPNLFGNDEFKSFRYSVMSFSYEDEFSSEDNVNVWWIYCRKKVDRESIYRAIYTLDVNNIKENSPNDMIQYLCMQNDTDALNYLRFAKSCEQFNSREVDPWERNDYAVIPERTKLIYQALDRANESNNISIKRRYAFIALRLAWYNGQYDMVCDIFNTVFDGNVNKDILYYWSLYFQCLADNENLQKNYHLAQVFAHAKDKRFSCHLHFNPKITVHQSLKFAKNNDEKCNVWLLYAIEKPDKALEYLQEVYALNPSSAGLSCLVMREVNKLEDYVLTPYYTLFDPAIIEASMSYEARSNVSQMLHRSELDRRYARQVLEFLNAANLQKVSNPLVWETAKAHMYFLVRDYDKSLDQINSMQKSSIPKDLDSHLDMLKALVLCSNQAKGKARIPAQAQIAIEKHITNHRFLFAMAKELEYLGNSTDAALLLSLISKEEGYSTQVFWRAKKRGIHMDYQWFNCYKDYINVAYSPEQLQMLINDILQNKDKRDDFSQLKYTYVQDAISELYDMLGIKYMRQNRFKLALDAFSKVDVKYSIQAFTSWGDNNNVFTSNPFFELDYTPMFIEHKDVLRLNKHNITKQLMNYLERANNMQEKDRDYYYFVVATAYYNMGIEGNSKRMKRYNDWYGQELDYFEDRNDFYQSNTAKKYYLLAMKWAKTDKFKALCLRMVVRCEKHRLKDIYKDKRYDDNYDSLIAANTYINQLRNNYPAYYDDLISNCDNFKTYFNARR